MKSLHYQCTSGISGDMNLGAMVDLGVDPTVLTAELRKLGLDGWSLHFEKDQRGGIHGTRCDVRLTEPARGATAGKFVHTAHHQQQEHEHRAYREIRRLIEASSLRDAVKADALAVFQVLAGAEAAVHGVAVDDVHFHEVGAVDSIIDIVGAAIAWDLLGVRGISSSPVELGGGHVQCAHGRLPVPAPATARLAAGMEVTLGASDHETTTPTGAALLAGRHCRFGPPAPGRPLRAGTGIGQRKDARLPNILQVILLETDEAAAGGRFEQDRVWELAANLDDLTPEKTAFLCEELVRAGAFDVWQTPITARKGRSAVIVSALAPEDAREAVTGAFMHHSTTLGVRRRVWERDKLRRRIEEVDTPLGRVRVKIATLDGVDVRWKPEFDDCLRLARLHGKSLHEIEAVIRQSAGTSFPQPS